MVMHVEYNNEIEGDAAVTFQKGALIPFRKL